MATTTTLIVLFVLCCSINIGHGLRCFDCIDRKLISSAAGEYTLGKQTNPSCEAASILDIGSLYAKTCPAGSMCAAAKGTITIKDEFGNYNSRAIVIRTCGQADATGCSTEKDTLVEFVGGYTGFASVEFKGEVCHCNQDYCSPIECPYSYAKIAGYCLDWWIVLCLVLGSLLLVFLLTCCCCCCCCCCRGNKKTPGRVVSVQPSPATEFENKLHGVAASSANIDMAAMDGPPPKYSKY